MVFVVTWGANVASAIAVYVAARHVGRPFFQGRLGERLLRPRALRRLELAYGRHGTWGIFLSRFVPGLRAVVPPFAGLAGLGWARTVMPLAIASAIWYGTLTALAATVVSELDGLVRLVSRLNRGGVVIGCLLIAAAVAWWLRHRRRGRRVEVGDE